MKNLVRKFAPAVAAAGVLMMASVAAQAECVNEGRLRDRRHGRQRQVPGLGSGAAGDRLGFLGGLHGAGGMVPSAPGYKVSDVRSSCKPGGLGQTCTCERISANNTLRGETGSGHAAA